MLCCTDLIIISQIATVADVQENQPEITSKTKSKAYKQEAET